MLQYVYIAYAMALCATFTYATMTGWNVMDFSRPGIPGMQDNHHSHARHHSHGFFFHK